MESVGRDIGPDEMYSAKRLQVIKDGATDASKEDLAG